MDRELQEALSTLSDSYSTGFDRVVASQKSFQTELTNRVDALETKLNRPGALRGGIGSDKDRSAEMADWEAFLRRGPGALERNNALTVGDDTSGGYLAPGDFVADLARNVVLYSPIRSLARVSSMSVGSVKLPRRTGTLTAVWTGETETRSDGAGPAYGQDDFTAFEAACYIDVSTTLMEDAAFDIAAELAIDFAEEFGRLEGAAFTNGSDACPEGFMTSASVAVKNSGAATAVTADGLIDLYHALPWPYRANAVFGMN
jgi:HK97 family phage major capsid protein